MALRSDWVAAQISATSAPSLLIRLKGDLVSADENGTGCYCESVVLCNTQRLHRHLLLQRGLMPRTPPDPDALCDLYVDESSQTKHRYLALGGIVVPTAKAGLLEESLKASRLPELPYGEIAWTKVSKSKLAAYKRHVDTILKPSLDLYPVQFHSIIVDTHKIRDNIWNGGSRENGFNKEIYQLLHKFLRLNKTKLFHVYLDKRESAIPLKELKSSEIF